MDAGTAATILGFGVAVVAARYAYLPYRAQKLEQERAKFVEVRGLIAERRAELTERALMLYDSQERDERLPGMLSSACLIPEAPVPIASVVVNIVQRSMPSAAWQKKARQLLPKRLGGERIGRYSEALGLLARPKLWFNAPCYSLEGLSVVNGTLLLQVSVISYFDGIDVSESLAHELASKGTGVVRLRRLPLRRMFPSPTVLSEVGTVAAVSALVLRVADGTATFYLHERDPRKVAMAGGQLHLAPSGVYQPSSGDLATVSRDRLPILTLCRELAEEYLGVEEARGADGAQLSYTDDEPYSSILAALSSSTSVCSLVGVGLDPLTLCPELLVMAALPGTVFDELFADLRYSDNEGRLVGAKRLRGRLIGFSFDEPTLSDLFEGGRLSPASQALLSEAWRHRDVVFSI